MKSIVFSLLILSILAPAKSYADFDIEIMKSVLARIKDNGQMTTATTKWLEDAVIAKEDPIELDTDETFLDGRVRQEFSRLQTLVFGKDNVLKLKACLNCHAKTSAGVVYIQKITVTKNTWAVVAFILAHEISHNIVDESVALNGGSISPLGVPEPPLEIDREHIENFKATYARAHSEVDAYAALLLFMSGEPCPSEMLKFIRAIVRDQLDRRGGIGDIDARARLATLPPFLKQLWPEASAAISKAASSTDKPARASHPKPNFAR